MSNLLAGKLSFAELLKRSEEIASGELLSSISGGTENDCHFEKKEIKEPDTSKPCTASA